ncbi:MAG: RHS repeat-associated core domain-containing protein [Acidobacteriaceae bacterium]
MTGYIYNADGERVAKGSISSWSCDPTVSGFTTTNDYILGLSGEQVTEMGVDPGSSAATTWQHTNVYANGEVIATYDPNGLHFYLNDWQGTRRAQTDYTGVLEQTCSSLPFGDSLNCSQSQQYPTEHHFTGKERDAESGNDYFEARYYASSMGRFLSPDWASKAEAVPYAQMSDPQSLNLYAYVGNNPLSRTDLSGHTVEVGYFPNVDAMVDPLAEQFYAQKAQQQSSSSSTSTTEQREQHQYDLVVERTDKLLGTTDAADHIDPDGTLSGGNYDFAINHNDKSDAAFQRELNNALGEADGDTGAHGGLTPPTHRVGFHISLHHDNDALHVDHFNGAKFPVGTLLHAIVDVGVGSIFYGSHQAFPYAGVQ